MTKQELILFIESFNKKPGEYSIEDAVEIGIKMKYLPVKERSWNWLIKYLGITNLSPNALRKRVEKRFHNNFNMSDEAIEFKNKYSSQYKEREWVNAYRRLIREDVRIDNLKDEIRLVVEKLNALPAITPKEIDLDPNENEFKQEAVLLLSDWHIGQESKNFYNTYNLEIAKNRINKLVDQVIYYCQTQKIYHLHILNLGDMIEGIINISARVEQTMDVIEQIMRASEFLAQFLNVLDSLGISIDYRNCVDNHSRITADKKQHVEKENLNLLINWYLKERLKNTSIHFIDDNLDEGFGKFTLNNGKNVVFMHGHNDAKSQILQNVVGATHAWVDYVFLGHYHNPATHTFQDMRVFINGSLCGVGTYALNQRLFTQPSQKLVIFNQNTDDVLDIDVLLN